MQNPRLHCKIFLHLIPEPEEKASELLRDLIANDMRRDLLTEFPASRLKMASQLRAGRIPMRLF